MGLTGCFRKFQLDFDFRTVIFFGQEPFAGSLQLLGACNYPICRFVFTDRSHFSLNLSQTQIPTGTLVTIKLTMGVAIPTCSLDSSPS